MQKKGNTLDIMTRHAHTVYTWEWSLPADIICSEKRTVSEFRVPDNVQRQISEHIFALNGRYCVYYPPKMFRNTCGF